jgi:hypothetical protein
MRENTMTLAGNLTDDPQGLGSPLRHRWRSPFGNQEPPTTSIATSTT